MHSSVTKCYEELEGSKTVLAAEYFCGRGPGQEARWTGWQFFLTTSDSLGVPCQVKLMAVVILETLDDVHCSPPSESSSEPRDGAGQTISMLLYVCELVDQNLYIVLLNFIYQHSDITGLVSWYHYIVSTISVMQGSLCTHLHARAKPRHPFMAKVRTWGKPSSSIGSAPWPGPGLSLHPHLPIPGAG